MLRESTTAVVARGETWHGTSSTEPFEAGWATEAIIFVRALKPPVGAMPEARVQISPDGIRWIDEGARLTLPQTDDEVAFVRVAHFGSWLRLAADLSDGAETELLVTIHLK